MTEQEAIKCLENAKRTRDMVGILPRSELGKCIIRALKEIQQYRAIGTPDECMAAVEKQKAMKPKEHEDKFYGCPTCGNVLLHKWEKYPTKLMDKKNGLPYCLGCGQKLNWKGNDEE